MLIVSEIMFLLRNEIIKFSNNYIITRYTNQIKSMKNHKFNSIGDGFKLLYLISFNLCAAIYQISRRRKNIHLAIFKTSYTFLFFVLCS